MTTDHGPQDDIRPLTPAEADEALKKATRRIASEEEIDRIVEAVTSGELPKVNDHGPQRQPASEVCECCESAHDVRDAHGNMLCAMCRGAEYDELARLRDEVDNLSRSRTQWRELAKSRTKMLGVQEAELAHLRAERDEDAELLRRQSAIMEKLRVENERYRAALEEIAQWRVYELTQKLSADALRGEGGEDER